MIKIPLTQGKVAIINDEDYDLVSQYKWHTAKIESIYYAVATINKRSVLMHRLIMENPILGVDHINGDGLDNRKVNLRVASVAQNAMNSKANGNYSQYKGVTWHKRDKKWYVQIKSKFIGTFKSEIEAAKSYDRAAIDLFGIFARLNFPKEG